MINTKFQSLEARKIFIFQHFDFLAIKNPCSVKLSMLVKSLISVNAEISARILFSRIALQDIFATLKIRDYGMIYVNQ